MKTITCEQLAYTNVRKTPRIVLQKPFRSAEGEGVDEMILDYSEGGCRIISPVIYKIGDSLIIDIGRALKDTKVGTTILRLGKVVWDKVNPDGRGEYGVRFV